MKALQYHTLGLPPAVVDLDKPVPAAGEVLLRVTAAGICHSDQYIMNLPEDQYVYGVPLTLGHEGAGIVEEVGAGVTTVQVGEAVAVYGPWGCGNCSPCARGKENYCENAAAAGIRPPGLGAPGAMAEYMLVNSSRHLVPLGNLDPVQTVCLTDAGLTPYSAIKSSLARLLPGTTAVVIGAGGLGHMAVQILRAISATTVIALDISDEKRVLAKTVGAHHVFDSCPASAHEVKELTGGRGADVVFDFVGTQMTADLALDMACYQGEIVILGAGPGTVKIGNSTRPRAVSARAPYWGSRSELMEVFALARTGAIHVEVEQFSLTDAPLAYERLRRGEIRGRAVIVPSMG